MNNQRGSAAAKIRTGDYSPIDQAQIFNPNRSSFEI
jgi:hypothetical protein